VFTSSARAQLCEFEDNSLAEDLNLLFERTVNVPRMRYGKKQALDTLNEVALLLAEYLRNEKQTWIPRIVNFISARHPFSRRQKARARIKANQQI
jgi:hypothetical protein